MISVRRAALLGLDAPLSPIMAAVLGLWPEPDEPEIKVPEPTGAGANFSSRAPVRPVQRQPIAEEELGQEMSIARQAEERDLRETLELITALFAFERIF